MIELCAKSAAEDEVLLIFKAEGNSSWQEVNFQRKTFPGLDHGLNAQMAFNDLARHIHSPRREKRLPVSIRQGRCLRREPGRKARNNVCRQRLGSACGRTQKCGISQGFGRKDIACFPVRKKFFQTDKA